MEVPIKQNIIFLLLPNFPMTESDPIYLTIPYVCCTIFMVNNNICLKCIFKIISVTSKQYINHWKLASMYRKNAMAKNILHISCACELLNISDTNECE